MAKNGYRRQLELLVRADSDAALALIEEVATEVAGSPDEWDEEMILPLVKDLQGRLQAVANRVARLVILRDST